MLIAGSINFTSGELASAELFSLSAAAQVSNLISLVNSFHLQRFAERLNHDTLLSSQ